MFEIEPTPGLYRHFKGGVYQVLYHGVHSEANEVVVVYRSLADGRVWVRPVSNWLEPAVNDAGQQVQRFAKHDSPDITPGIYTVTLDLSKPMRPSIEPGRQFGESTDVLGVPCHVEFLEVKYENDAQEAAEEYWRSYYHELDRAFGFNAALHDIQIGDKKYVFFIYPHSQ